MATVERELTDEAPVGATISSVTTRQGPVRVPVERYVSAEWAALEEERLWPRVWQIACATEDVAAPGDYFEYEVGRLSVLIVRGDDGELRAFQNTCRHRGNLLCAGAGEGLSEIRCSYHRWSWDLAGRLREVPSRRGFGALRNDDYPLFPVQVGVWAGLVFVNLDLDAEPLEAFLENVPGDIAWAGPDEFRCTYALTVPLPCNWKVLIEAFSETYHVQGIHREMLRSTDDVNSPQVIWGRHGRMEQPYGMPSPRLRDGATDQEVWDSFVEVMGVRVGRPADDPGPAPPVPAGATMRDVIEERVREECGRRGVDVARFDQRGVMNLFQYNLFPNVTALFLCEIKQIIKARPGPTPTESFMDAMFFERIPAGGAPVPRPKPAHVTLEPGAANLGLIFEQDVANLLRAQRGLHQPGLTHLSLSGEECRIINLHRNLERHLGVAPDVGAQL